MSGPAPYGFRRTGDGLGVDPAEAEVVKKMVELFLRTRRIKTVARLLTEAGCRTRGGNAFTDTTVRRLLVDPEAVGSIVSADSWQRCQAILEDREKDGWIPGKQPVRLFGGKVFCSCGGPMQVRTGHGAGKFVCARCRIRIAFETLERIFVSELDGVETEPVEILDFAGDDRSAQAALARRLGGHSVRLSSVWPLLEAHERVELVDLVVSRIVVSNEEIAIELAIPSNSAVNKATGQGNTLPNNPSLEG